MAETHLAAWQRLGIPALIYSPSGRGARLAPRYGAVAAASVAELWAGADVIDICSPTDTHRPLAEAAFAAGRDVICEKPLARTLADGRALVAAAAATGRRLAVAHVVRYFAGYATAHDLMTGGAIGEVLDLHLRRTGAAPTQAWFHDAVRSGGVLLDQMIHDFDYARWTLGDVAEVTATIERDPAQPRLVRATATLTHIGGARSHLTGGWLASTEPFTTELVATGTAGSLRHSNMDGLMFVHGAAGDVTLAPDAGDLPYDAQLADLLAAVRGAHEPRVTAQDALRALELSLVAVEAARTGRPIRVR